MSVCPGQNIENTNNQRKYAVIRSENYTTTFRLFLEGHSAIYNLWDLLFQSFLFLIIARLPRHSNIQIYLTKHVAYYIVPKIITE